ncbi:zf-TFIIB domain-containing protein [Nocardiopsis sp. RSe5-2]|uniref:Zf-TFIIB domain-containing protein n=1 Tax=Nocardiopsis endophytica TaxID=3018445 RepID=A0ABT4TYR7_9ACTN|nr:zf-TFIIB domain-containing protein [Nocardiopsis endophytica]MDA2809277.1 zf-TFIIB domain-containing protein [Nocardiopsis endophytica]
MTCPKCQGRMQTFDRQGIHIEQCQGCRGIFLDRGELEQIIRAEESHYGAPPPYPGQQPHHGGPAYPVPPDSPRGYRGRPDSPRPYGHGGYGYKDSPKPYGGGYGYKDSPRPYGRRKNKSFLEQLFD